MRGYEAFRLMEEKVKAMLLALPLVQDLHHPAMRDRHWTLLQKVRRLWRGRCPHASSIPGLALL